MVEFTTETGTRVKVWVDSEGEIEPQSRAQLNEMGKLPFIHEHIAVMSDVHLGQGAVIGSVLPAKNAVVPNIVGVDIGCGISAYRTNVTRGELGERIRERGDTAESFWRDWEYGVRGDVPTGFDSHKTKSDWDGYDTEFRAASLRPLMEQKARYQLGTLGGGNHFIEAQVDADERVWFMVHSGSRHTGLRIASHYDEQAERLLDRTGVKYPSKLGYLPSEDELFHDYLHDMEWAVEFALENRWRMLERAYANFLMLCDEGRVPSDDDLRNVVRGDGINIHHNFARRETHFGEEVVVHRKGATSARRGEIGIIPGSMGTPSYIVKGRGSAESFESCSHGSGRVMSRRQAKKTIQQGDFEKSLRHTFTRASRGYVDEAPQSYKDVGEIIRRQAGLVEVAHKLTPIITVKGDSGASVD
ncbi:MAG: RtcB family protein [Candidatus Poribacteria bacterium]|nr:RtcB family protein [Candidatus Poribacteria bacterium]